MKELIVFTSKYKHDLYSTTIVDIVVGCSSQVKDTGSSLIECYRYVCMLLILQKRFDYIMETFEECKLLQYTYNFYGNAWFGIGYNCELVVPYEPQGHQILTH